MSSSETGPEKGVVIVGGGLAAARTAEQLRKSEYAGPVTIVSDEVHLPYDRPPLSKDVLHADLDDVTLKPAEFYDENDITLRLGSAAASLDTAARTLTLADGSVLGYDELIIAIGVNSSGNLYYWYQQATLNSNSTYSISLSPTTDSALTALLNSL